MNEGAGGRAPPCGTRPDDVDVAPFVGGSRAHPATGVSPAVNVEVAGDVEPLPAVSGADRYARGGVVGSGGMGWVVAARDAVLNREVAVKEAPAGPASARLAREARVAAQLEHPGIVPVYDAGTLPDGRPYYVMRLVRGRTLADALAERPRLADRLSLLRAFLQVCDAVAFAHGTGLVHRDLKPANVLLGELGETLVADWGLARPAARPDAPWEGVLSDDARATVAGTVVGTPAYMSPEQARGQPPDPRDDVYGLGAILHELLTGAPVRSGPDALEAARRGRVAAIRDPNSPPELVAIAARALAPEAAARYPSARELAADLTRFIDGHLVAAHAYSPWDHVRRFVRARRAPLGVAAVALLALAVVGVTAWRRTSVERDRAIAAEQATARSLDLANRHLVTALEGRAQAALDGDARPEAELAARQALTLGESPIARGVLAAFDARARPERVDRVDLPPCHRPRYSSTGDEMLCLGLSDVSLWRLDPPERRWQRPLTVTDGVVTEDKVLLTDLDSMLTTLDRADGRSRARRPGAPEARGLVPTAQGRFAVVASMAQAWVVEAGGERSSLHTICDGPRVPALTAALSPDEATLAAFCHDGTFAIGPALGGPLRRAPLELGPERPVIAAAFLVDDTRLVVGTEKGEIALVDATNGRVLQRDRAGVGRPVELRPSADGRRVVVRGERGGARIWLPHAGAWETGLPESAGNVARFDGPLLATFGADRQRWRLPEAPVPRRFRAGAGLSSAALSPDGAQLVGTTGDGRVIAWDARFGAVIAERRWQDGVVKGGAFSPDGRRYAAAGMADPRIRVFETERWTESEPLDARTQPFRQVAWLGGAVLALSYSSGPIVFRSAGAFTTPIATIMLQAGVDSTGDAAALVTREGEVWLLDAMGGRRLFDDPLALAVDLGARTLVVGRADAVLVHDPGGGAPRVVIPHAESRVLDVAIAPGDGIVATAATDGAVRLFDLADGRLRAFLRGHEDRVASVTFSADGATLVSASWDGTARRWDLRRLDGIPDL